MRMNNTQNGALVAQSEFTSANFPTLPSEPDAFLGFLR